MKGNFKKKAKELGLLELVAIALGGMVGGGIFSILGISVGLVGNATPIALLIGVVFTYFFSRNNKKLST